MSRLDLYLVEAGLCPSRSRAAALIREGAVTVNGRICQKPSFPVTFEEVALLETPLNQYVSRGALKLIAALEAFSVDPQDLICADLGASTGGFTQVLCLRGARTVYAVDSGHGQLHPSLREDPRVVSLEGVNARYPERLCFPRVDLAVMDVSFISQTLLFPSLAAILKDEGRAVTLIKPQFELSREWLSRGGIVRSEEGRRKAVERVRQAAEENGFFCHGLIPSPITGGDGNGEFLALWTKSPESSKEESLCKP